MFATIINDTSDANALGRQATRTAAILNCPVVTVGVENDLSAAGNLVDMLDASNGRKGVILVNVAPRSGRAKQKWPNGTPFGYFHHQETLIVSSIDGNTLSLAQKLIGIKSIQIFDLPEVMSFASSTGLIEQGLADAIVSSQFRSFEFLPRTATWLIQGHNLPSSDYTLEGSGLDGSVWYIDNFGNAKTTLLPEQIGFEAGKEVELSIGKVKCLNRLKDVPDGEAALIIGSSGLSGKRLLEVVVQGGSAAQRFDLTVGAKL